MKRALTLSLALAALAAFSPPPAPAQPAYLVKNIRADGNTASSEAYLVVEAGGRGYFSARSVFDGRALWRSDGTPDGTVMAYNSVAVGNYFESGGKLYFGASGFFALDPASDTVAPLAQTLGLHYGPFELGGVIYFSASASDSGHELWRTDGTPQGTFLVADVAPGPGSGVTRIFGAVNGFILFVGNDGVFGDEIWRSDGTAAGTTRLADIAAGSQDAFNFGPNEFLLDGSVLYFPAESALGVEPWISNGQAAGTFRLADIMPGAPPSYPVRFTKALGKVYFGADGLSGTELWQTDGSTLGTSLVKTVDPSPGGTITQIIQLGNRLLVMTAGGASTEPTVSDGTPQGSVQLDLNASGASFPSPAAVAGGLAFFSALPDNSSPLIVYKSDATVAGTIPVIDPLSSQPIVARSDLFSGAGFCYVASGDGVWKTDGTPQETERIWEALALPWGFSVTFLRAIDDLVYFSVEEGGSDNGVYVRDEGLGQTRRLTFDSAQEALGEINGKLVFVPETGSAPFEPWVTDGTAQGTRLLRDIANGDLYTGPYWLTDLNGTLLFSAGDGDTGRELWKSDGTESGTTLLKDLVVGLSGDPKYITTLNGKAYFSGGTADQGRELWVTDGTTAGTTLLADLAPGAFGSDPAWLVRAGSHLYFSADIFPATGRELWRTDGTVGGTQPVADLALGSFSSMGTASPIVAIGDTAYFVASNGGQTGIWKTAGGDPIFTGVVSNLGGNLRDLTASGPYLFYTRDFRKLFRYDEATGESLVHDFSPSFNRFTSVAAANGSIYFGMDDGDGNVELWKSDGATSATFRVADINPGLAASGASPSLVINGGQTVLLGAFTSDSGDEWWVSDGSASGTRRFQDIAPLASGSLPRQFTVAGGNLYFAATDGSTGLELWAAPLSALAAPTITLQPKSQSANAGQSIVFVVEAVGPGQLTYQWEKDGALIPNATAPTLALGPLDAADAGVYACHVAGSTAVTASSLPAALDVFAPPLLNLATFVKHTLPAKMHLGESLFIGVTMRDTSGVSWSRPQGYALGVASDPAAMLGAATKFELPPPPLVVPAVNGLHDFVIQVTAPATPGTYTAQLRMVEGNGPGFGQTADLTIEAIERPNAAQDWELFD